MSRPSVAAGHTTNLALSTTHVAYHGIMRAGLCASVLSLVFLAACSNDDPDSADGILAAASDAMADESFKVVDEDCPLCPPPTVMEFAPPDRVKLSGNKGHDAWPYALLIGDEAYVSSAGHRWQTGGGALEFLGMSLGDPRVLVTVLRSAELSADEEVDGREAAVVEAELDYDAFFDRLHESFHEEGARDSMRGLLEGTRVRLWIDREDHRVVQMQLFYPDPEGQTEVVELQYAPVDVPTEVESMDSDEAHEMGQQVERAGERLLLAIADYRAARGSYPPAVDPGTLSDVISADEWPINPFSGDPVRQSPDTPGDFDYRLINGDHDIQFWIYGWDDSQLHYDSARFGPLDRFALGR